MEINRLPTDIQPPSALPRSVVVFLLGSSPPLRSGGFAAARRKPPESNHNPQIDIHQPRSVPVLGLSLKHFVPPNQGGWLIGQLFSPAARTSKVAALRGVASRPLRGVAPQSPQPIKITAPDRTSTSAVNSRFGVDSEGLTSTRPVRGGTASADPTHPYTHLPSRIP